MQSTDSLRRKGISAARYFARGGVVFRNRRSHGERMEAAPITLLIEDDEDARTAFASLLRRHGIDVVSVRTGREGLRELRAGIAPRVILLDDKMPRKDGACFRRAQRADPELAAIPVVVFSAPDRPSDGAQADTPLPAADFDRLLFAIQWHCGRTPPAPYST